MKQCRSCKENKELDQFFRDSGLIDGRANICKSCKQLKTYAWRRANKEKYNAYMKQKNKDRYPEARLQRYGVTNEWFQVTLLSQNSKCAICNKENKSVKRALAVDHDHKSGKVRGILCYNCNRLLHAFDNASLHEAIVAYLAKYRDAA